MPDLIQDHPAAKQLDQYTFDELNEHLATHFEFLDPEKLARTSPYEVGMFLERLTVFWLPILKSSRWLQP